MRQALTLFCAIFAYMCVSVSAGAQVTENPYVESAYESAYGEITVKGVAIVEDATLVMIQDITARNVRDQWISFSSRTVLSYSGRSVKLQAWGLWNGDELITKDFDTPYSLTADRKYDLVLVFPKIPSDVQKISIVENVENGFYWRGIHLKSGSAGAPRSTPDAPSRLPDSRKRTPDSRSEGNDWARKDRWDNGDRYSREEEPFSPTGSGTCFAINEKGYIATCYHVVEGAHKFRVRGIGGDFNKSYVAELVSVDRPNDLAVLKISSAPSSAFAGIPYAVQSRLADVGEDVFVLGYPLRPIMGDEIKLTNGLISSRSGYQGDEVTYQISAAVQSGNSGGPLFDKSGNVIGVVNARLMVESAAYAVKGSYLDNLCKKIGVGMSTSNTIKNLSLAEQIKKINKFIYIIEVQ